MLGKYRLFSIGNLPVYITPTFLFVTLLFVGYFSYGPTVESFASAFSLGPYSVETAASASLPERILIGSIVVGIMHVSIFLHELGHTYVGRLVDYDIDNVTMWMLGGAAHIEHDPTSGKSEFYMALAGPLVTFWIAFTGFIIAAISQPLLPDTIILALLVSASVNVIVGLFNLIPAFPLDGGRILRGILTIWFPFDKATKATTAAGKVLAATGLIVGGILMMPAVLLLSIFVFFAASAEQEEYRYPSTEEIEAHIDAFESEAAADTPVTVAFSPEIDQALKQTIKTQGVNQTVADEITDDVDYCIVGKKHRRIYSDLTDTYDFKVIPEHRLVDRVDDGDFC